MLKRYSKRRITNTTKNKYYIAFIIVMAIICLFSINFIYHLLTDALLICYKYTIYANVSESIRIVQLTDLHNAEIGSENSMLIQSIEKSKPDIILTTGDMIEKDNPDTSVVEDLVEELVDIAPVYFSYGNHETTWDENYAESKGTTIAGFMKDKGATVVDFNYIDVDINGNELRIGGYMGYYRFPGMLEYGSRLPDHGKSFFDEFEDTDRYTILLNHIPTQWVDWGHIDDFDVDLVFSGHYHGGQWVLPVVGPVYAPYVGLFPEHVKGSYVGEKATCILSAGLGNEYKMIPRINNPPEMVIVDLIPSK